MYLYINYFIWHFIHSPRRKLHISIEALFMIDFPTLKHKFSFFLDRREQRVTLDISASGVTESIQFIIPNINETSTIRSLALHFHKNRIALLVDCKESDAHELDMNLSKLYIQMDDPVIKLVSRAKWRGINKWDSIYYNRPKIVPAVTKRKLYIYKILFLKYFVVYDILVPWA